MVERSQVVPVRVAVELTGVNLRRLRLDLADEGAKALRPSVAELERAERELERVRRRLLRLERRLAAERGEVGA